jgi:hypothetical protein
MASPTATIRVEQGLRRTPALRIAVERRNDWLRNSVVSGFVATVGVTAGLAALYGLASAAGAETGGTVARWLWALTHNTVVNQTGTTIALGIALHLVAGLLWALCYGRWVEPDLALAGPGWRKGLLFALAPWVVSVVAFLPLIGGGFLGFAIGAGPLPLLGSFVLHAIYGVLLGAFYAIPVEAGLDDAASALAASAAERGAALGLGAGVVAGGFAGWIVGADLGGFGSDGATMLAGALVAGAVAAMLGSLIGMDRAAIGS